VSSSLSGPGLEVTALSRRNSGAAGVGLVNCFLLFLLHGAWRQLQGLIPVHCIFVHK